LCVSAVCEPPATGDGEATCVFNDIGPDICESPTEPLCTEPTGACDPATGQCAYPELPCGPEVATKIYVPIENDAGFVGTAICDVTHGADGAIASVTCRTRDEGGVQVLDLI